MPKRFRGTVNNPEDGKRQIKLAGKRLTCETDLHIY